VPGFSGTPEPVETIALVCKAGELIGLWLALAIGWPDRIATWTASIKALVRGATSDSRTADTRRSDLPTRGSRELRVLLSVDGRRSDSESSVTRVAPFDIA
jgi:hypothetical protein